MAYTIHHLNTATLCPGPERLVHGKGSLIRKGRLSCHCLLIETQQGLILVDTGFSLRDIQNAEFGDRLSQASFGAIADPNECAKQQIQALGFKPKDVTHIILTHLDADHAGGIKDFPHAKVHLHAEEQLAGTQPVTWFEKVRYQAKHWAHEPDWQVHRAQGETWFGFDSVQMFDESLSDLLLIPLPGHSRGHCGVAVATDDGWLLHCGDAYFSQSEIKQSKPYCPPLLNAVQTLDESSRAQRLSNQQRLRELHQQHHDEVKLICSHDMSEFEACCRGRQHVKT